MTSNLFPLGFDANDPHRLARYWSGVLGWEIVDDAQGITLLPGEEAGIRFLPTREEKVRPNQIHCDLTSTTLELQQETVARSLRLGGRHHDIGQGPDVDYVVSPTPRAKSTASSSRATTSWPTADSSAR